MRRPLSLVAVIVGCGRVAPAQQLDFDGKHLVSLDVSSDGGKFATLGHEMGKLG